MADEWNVIPRQLKEATGADVQFKILIDTETKAEELPEGRLPTMDEFKRGFPAPAIGVKIFRMFQKLVNSPDDQAADRAEDEIRTFLKLADRPVPPPVQAP